MSTSGLNPTGTLFFGANNTTSVSIGFDDAITIDNTTAEISVNGTIYNGSGTPTNFTSLILSNAGFNPSGSLNIGTSNTSEITIGPLKIDNTVVPPQLYMNGVSLPPGGLASNGDKFTLVADASQINNNGGDNVIAANLQFINVNNSTIVTVDSIPGVGQNNKLVLAQSGIYRFNVTYNIQDSGIAGTTGNITLRSLASGAFSDINQVPQTSSPDIVDSDIPFTFTDNIIVGTMSENKQFLVYALIPDASFTIYSYIEIVQLNKIGTEISIERVGEWPPIVL